MTSELEDINQQITAMHPSIDAIEAEIAKAIVGQRYLVERLLIGLLANGHVLLEGVPGLAKTATISALAQTIQTKFARIQFTPDLLPSDLVGNLIYNPREGTYSTKKGPIFANLILADEINRAPAKVQSALLEAMQERQVTIGDETYPLPSPFLVLATQNPIRPGGHVRFAGSAGRSLHAKGGYRLSERGRGEADHEARGADRCAPASHRDRSSGNNPRDAEIGRPGARRRADRELHHQSRLCHARTLPLCSEDERDDTLRSQSARVDQSRTRRQGSRVPSRPRLRYATGREENRA
jgi:hypothetical protein